MAKECRCLSGEMARRRLHYPRWPPAFLCLNYYPFLQMASSWLARQQEQAWGDSLDCPVDVQACGSPGSEINLLRCSSIEQLSWVAVWMLDQ